MIFSFNKVQENLPEMLRQKVFLECPLFDNMSHIRLTFALIIEKLNSQSKWKPYLDILPEKFRTVLYFTPAEMKELQGTMALTQALKQVKFIATQYAFLYKYLMVAIENHPVVEELQNSFTYEFYRWAVSVITTRQNIIPQDDGTRESVLIPLWDMANHVNGIINTQYNDETRQIESFCLNDFDAGQQVTMAYGNRSNEQFLIHNGFVYSENENKDLNIKLSLSKSDQLFNDRSELLKKLNLQTSGSFQISPQFSSEFLAFVRVFNMSKDQIEKWLKADNTKDLLNPDTPLDVAFQKRIIQFILIRIKILLKAFPTTLEEDQVMLENGVLSKTKNMLVQYRILEKKIFHEVLSALEEQIKLLK
jgi:histone-lysine N-methyltransferase SETD3